jgi:cyclopropane fatty-acyl-phospholipid synthase-like methyltransferase
MLDRPDAAMFFNGFAEHFNTIYDGRRNAFMRWMDVVFRKDMFVRFRLTFEEMEVLRGKTLLDIGCGSGPYVAEALHRGASWVTAVDPAPNMLTLLARRLAADGLQDRCRIIEGAFPEVQLHAHDHVIVMGVLDYICDAGSFLAALRPLVGQSAVVSFPSRHWFRTPIRQTRYRLKRCPVYFYTNQQIRELSRAAGFQQVHIHKIPGAGMDYHVCLKP